jgi:hypothetical protein
MRVHQVSRTTRLQRVLVPAQPLRNCFLTDFLGHQSGALIGSRADLLRLGALFRLAAASPHSAVYLPLRANGPTYTTGTWVDDQGFVDLVVHRSDTALAPSAWPQLRARLRRGPKPGSPATIHAPRPREGRPLFPDLVDLNARSHAATIFFSGVPATLFYYGDELTWVGEQVASNREIRRFGGPALLSDFTGPDRKPGRRDGSWECMIMAYDSIFHRNRWRRRPSTEDEEAE